MQITSKDAFLAQFERAMCEAAHFALDKSHEEADRRRASFEAGLHAPDMEVIKRTARDLEGKDNEIAAAAQEASLARLSRDNLAVSPAMAGVLVPDDPGMADARKRVDAAETRVATLRGERRATLRGCPILAYVEVETFNQLDMAARRGCFTTRPATSSSTSRRYGDGCARTRWIRCRTSSAASLGSGFRPSWSRRSRT